MTYVSERGFPLLLSTVPARPTLTVENYCKWYALYLVDHDKPVQPISFGELEGHASTAYCDHVPNPEAVYGLCKARGWDLHPEAYEMIIGRWELTLWG